MQEVEWPSLNERVLSANGPSYETGAQHRDQAWVRLEVFSQFGQDLSLFPRVWRDLIGSLKGLKRIHGMLRLPVLFTPVHAQWGERRGAVGVVAG